MILLLGLLFQHSSFAQDIILTKDYTVIRAHILSSDDTIVKYRLFESQDNAIYSLERSLIYSIRFENGTVWNDSQLTTEESSIATADLSTETIPRGRTAFTIGLEINQLSKSGNADRFWGPSIGVLRLRRLTDDDNTEHPVFIQYGADVAMTWHGGSQNVGSIGSADISTKTHAQWGYIQPYAVVHYTFKTKGSLASSDRSSVYGGLFVSIPYMDNVRIDTYKNGSRTEKGNGSDMGVKFMPGVILGYSPNLCNKWSSNTELCIGFTSPTLPGVLFSEIRLRLAFGK